MRTSFRRVGMFKNKHCELLDRHEIGLPPAGVKINRMIAYIASAYERVSSLLYMYYVILVTTVDRRQILKP